MISIFSKNRYQMTKISLAEMRAKKLQQNNQFLGNF